MEPELDYDYIIIGSGFGGSVSALRLSEKGYKVLVVEKGKWYGPSDFAKNNRDLKRWLWLPFLRWFGIMKISLFRHITVVSGVGVGGGSLVYANTLPIPKSDFYNSGSWKDLCNWEDELRVHYQTASKMLGVTKNPGLFESDKALRNVARKLGREAYFSPTRVGVYFGEVNKTHKDPYFKGKGPKRTGCNFCGACMTGCPNNSKNSLDKNYLFLAKANGAEIRAENEVTNIKPLTNDDGSDGYEVILTESTRIFKKRKIVRSRGLVISAGVIGTLKLLLKMKRTSLKKLSNRLGKDIRTNNETLVSVSSLDKELDFSKGIAIGSMLQTDHYSHVEAVRYGKGSNTWKWLHLPYSTSKSSWRRIISVISRFFKSPIDYFKIYFTDNWARKTTILLFMQTLDSTLAFKRNIFGRMGSRLGKGAKPSAFIRESIQLTSEFSRQVKGKATSYMGETILGIPSTAHLLGGAVMGKDRRTGVINDKNEVFGYQNMYIIDGSMISANPGVNPSLSITAIAEHAMSKIKAKN